MVNRYQTSFFQKKKYLQISIFKGFLNNNIKIEQFIYIMDKLLGSKQKMVNLFYLKC